MRAGEGGIEDQRQEANQRERISERVQQELGADLFATCATRPCSTRWISSFAGWIT